MQTIHILTYLIATLNATKSACGAPIRDNTPPSIIIPSVGLFVLLLVALRIYTRLVVSKLDANWDDGAAILLGVSIPNPPSSLNQVYWLTIPVLHCACQCWLHYALVLSLPLPHRMALTKTQLARRA